MVDERSWNEFKDSGLLWYINTILHVFGWAICVEVDKDNGNIIRAYPSRVTFRGFPEKSNTNGYIKVSEYLNANSEQLLNESKN